MKKGKLAAAAAATVHGLAARSFGRQVGLTAGDIVGAIPAALG